MTVAWREQQERGSRWAIRLMGRVTRSLGRPVARTLLYPICLYYLCRSKEANRSLRRFYERAGPGQVGWRALFHHYYWFASTILDRVYFLGGCFGRFEIKIHGLETLDRVLAKGQGCLLLGSHLGSFEVVRAIGLSRRDIEVRVLMDEQNAPLIRDLTRELNPAIANTVIQVGGPETMLQVKECLDRGGVVGIMGDRLITADQSVPCEFLGKEAPFPTGSMRLAHVVCAPIVMFFGLYRGSNRYDVHLELLSETIWLSSEQREADTKRWMQRYADCLAHHTREAPDNWFNFYDFWYTSH